MDDRLDLGHVSGLARSKNVILPAVKKAGSPSASSASRDFKYLYSLPKTSGTLNVLQLHPAKTHPGPAVRKTDETGLRFFIK